MGHVEAAALFVLHGPNFFRVHVVRHRSSSVSLLFPGRRRLFRDAADHSEMIPRAVPRGGSGSRVGKRLGF